MKCGRDFCAGATEKPAKRVATGRATYDECATCQRLDSVIDKRPEVPAPKDKDEVKGAGLK